MLPTPQATPTDKCRFVVGTYSQRCQRRGVVADVTGPSAAGNAFAYCRFHWDLMADPQAMIAYRESRRLALQNAKRGSRLGLDRLNAKYSDAKHASVASAPKGTSPKDSQGLKTT